MKKQIGWYTVKESEIFTNLFECAAWYEDVLVQPGRYELFSDVYSVRDDGKIECWANSAYALLHGTIVSDDFGARFFGMPLGNYDHSKNAGKPSSHTVRPYLYGVAESVLTNADTPYELLTEYEARKIIFKSPIDGKTLTTYGIFTKEVVQ